jgi:PleD family two-component response regulator
MLNIFFSGQGYEVDVADRGSKALDQCRKGLPDLVVLDIMLPDMDGYAVCKAMRETTRTSHIPIIFLTQKDERSDKIAGLELGADDYITKPFDIEELKLRVGTAIRTHQRLNMTDPRTGLPSARLIEDQLRAIMQDSTPQWTLFLVGVDNLGPFTDAYGFVAGDEVMRFTAMLLNEVVNNMGTLDDFIGHSSNETLVLITVSDDVDAIEGAIRDKFNEDIPAHYNFIDREQGGILLSDGSLAPLMKLSIGIVSGRTQRFSDIREITELAAENRQIDQNK